MKKFLLTTALSLVLPSMLLNANDISLKTLEGFSSPESVYVKGKSVFVANVGEKLDPLNKDNDGFISLLDTEGKVVEAKFLSNLDAPKGMSVVGNKLYVVDIDTIKGFDLGSKKQIFSLPIKDAVFLNDITVLDKNTLLVSDTGTGLVLKVSLKTKKYETFIKMDSKFGGPNGLVVSSNSLYIAGYDPNGKIDGSLLKVDLKTKQVSTFSELKGALDGIALDKKGNLIVSSWGSNMDGKLFYVKKDGSFKEIENLGSLKGPADLYLDGQTLWVPEMAANKVLRISLP